MKLMKRFLPCAIKIGSALAMMMVALNVNSACFAWQHQEEVPASALRLKKIKD